MLGLFGTCLILFPVSMEILIVLFHDFLAPIKKNALCPIFNDSLFKSGFLLSVDLLKSLNLVL